MTELLKTERLTYRPLLVGDAPSLYAIVNDYDVVRMTATWPWPVSLAYVEDRLTRQSRRSSDDSKGLGIFADGAVVGSMGGYIEKHEERGEETVRVGYMLGRQWWGNGLMTEALLFLCTYLRGCFGNRDIYAEHFFDNTASGRVMIKAGFQHVGPAPDVWCEARQELVSGQQYRLAAEAAHEVS